MSVGNNSLYTPQQEYLPQPQHVSVYSLYIHIIQLAHCHVRFCQTDGNIRYILYTTRLIITPLSCRFFSSRAHPIFFQ